MSNRGGDEPLGFKTKAALAYEALRGEIIRGDLPGGLRLDQDELARRFNISRQPLRQALQWLVSERLVEWRAHHSATVAELSRDGFEEFYVMRVALEGALAKVAAPLMDAETMTSLRAMTLQMRQAVLTADLESFVNLDRCFHATLYAPSGYLHALAEVIRLRDLTDRYIYCYVANRDGALRSISEHESLVDAAASRDGQLLSRLVSAHVETGAVMLREIIAEGSLAMLGTGVRA